MSPLKSISIFSTLSPDELAQITLQIEKRTYKSATLVFSHNDPSTLVYFLFKGTVRATTYTARGKEICYQQLHEGDMFGELSAIDGLQRTTSIITETDCELGIISSNQLWAMMKKYPSVMAGVLKRLSSLARFLCSRVYEYGALGARERTRAEILRLARQNMTGRKNALIKGMPTHEDIANRIASHREAVTKEFSYLTKKGLIQKKGKTLIVPDVDALTATILEAIL